MRRRAVLVLGGTFAVSTVAGCTSGGSDDSPYVRTRDRDDHEPPGTDAVENVEIVQETLVTDGDVDRPFVEGHVRNNGEEAVLTTIVAEFYDRNGDLLATESEFVGDLREEEPGAFEIAVPEAVEASAVVDYELAVTHPSLVDD